MSSRKVTMYTIAAETGLSIAAVSRAFDPHSRLKPEKRQLILDTAKRLGYVQNKMASRLSGDAMKIGVLIYGTLEVYYREYVAGIRDAHAEFVDYKVDCDLRLLDRSRDALEAAYAVLDEFIAAGVDGVVINGLSSSEHTEPLRRLADAGIPFILLDSDVPDSLRSGVSMNDTATAGRMAAQLLSCGMAVCGASTKKTAVFPADAGNLSQVSLTDSFRAGAAEYGLEVVRICDTENRTDLAEELLEGLLADHPDLGGIYISSANSMPICHRLRARGLAGKLAVVTSDVFDELNGCIMDGTVFATIYQDPFMQARAAFEALYRAAAEGTPIPERILARPQAVLRSNLELYTKRH
ncbi:MAG: LacI family DNA-binding transcriptional regulator [Clostridia bacterium]|nr:LacI family DNA-binding transcriptional regulator [Clostridia bacterium]